MIKRLLIILLSIIFENQVFAADFAGCKTLFNDGKFNASAVCFSSILKNNENDVQSRFWYAASLYYDKKYEPAYQQYAYIAQKYPNSQIGKYSQKEAEKVKKRINYINNAKANDNGNYVSELDYATKWNKNPIRVWIQPSQYSSTAKQAFIHWQTKSENTVTFVFVTNKNAANIRLSFVDRLTNSTTKDQLGSTNLKFNGKKNNSANIELLQRTKSNQLFSNKQIYHTALHEIGHALGMSGHSKNNNDIMYYNSGTNSISLSNRDINTLKAIYKK